MTSWHQSPKLQKIDFPSKKPFYFGQLNFLHYVPQQKHFFGGSQILEVFTLALTYMTTSKMSDKWPSKDLTAFHTVINGYLLDCWVRKKKSDWNKIRNTFFTWDIQIQERSLDKTLNKFTLMTDMIKTMHNIRQWAEVSWK